jgi:hypothetical protein
MAMAHVDQHTMQLERAYESGAEEWVCPICERRLIIQWSPTYKKIILDSGDEYATHGDGKGKNLNETAQVQAGEPPDTTLAPIWLEAIEALDFGD